MEQIQHYILHFNNRRYQIRVSLKKERKNVCTRKVDKSND